MQVTLDHTEQISPTVRTFWFRPDSRVTYTAGQYIELYLPHDSPDSRGEKRWFTLSSSPTEELISITTRLQPSEGSSFKQVLASLAPGTTVNMTAPMGDFVLPKDTSIPLVFVAGGMGITPMRSMVKWLTDTNEQRDITLLFAAENNQDLIFYGLFQDYGVHMQPILTNPPENWHGEDGRLTTEKILDMAPDSGNTLYYLSGPELMIEMFVADFHETKFDESRLVTDYFPGYQPI